MVMASQTRVHELHLTSWLPTVPQRLSPNLYPTRLDHRELEGAGKNRVDDDNESMMAMSGGRE